jgi:TonB family protein
MSYTLTADPYEIDEEEAEQSPGRVRSDSELSALCRARRDIFCTDNDLRLKKMESACLLASIAVGALFSRAERSALPPPVFVDVPSIPSHGVTVRPEGIDRPEPVQPKPPAVVRPVSRPERIVMRPHRQPGPTGRGIHGGGSPLAHITRTGVLGLLASRVIGISSDATAPDGIGGHADRIDAMLSGSMSLAGMGNGGAGRQGEAGIGYGTGYGSGFGGGDGGSGGIDDLYAMSDAGELPLKKRPVDPILGGGGLDPDIHGGAVMGGRNKAGILRVVQQNVSALRYAYNRFLSQDPGLKGKVTVKFAIDEFGKVMFCQITNSSTGNDAFDQTIIAKIKRWAFDRIDRPGDVTEVTYPFVFAQ